jgi:hypothetical protein
MASIVHVESWYGTFPVRRLTRLEALAAHSAIYPLNFTDVSECFALLVRLAL